MTGAPDRVIAARILPVLGAAALGLVPFTVFSSLLIDISGALNGRAADVGGLRGLGGIAAVIVGLGYASIAQRLRSTSAVALGLVLLGIFSAIGTIAQLPATIVFCLGIGAATSILNPALQTSAASAFRSPSDQGRAATMVTATTTLTAVLAAPVIGGLSMLLGWQGTLLAVAAVSIALAIGMQFVRRRAARMRTDGMAADGAPAGPGARSAVTGSSPTPAPSPAPKPGGALRTVLVDRRARGLIAISCLRTAAFMGALAVMAAVYAERHGLAGGVFTLVWTASGVSFFLGNWWTGRMLATAGHGAHLLGWGIATAFVGVILVFAVTPLPLMVLGTALSAVGHAMIAAAVTTALASTSGDVRPAALAMNGVAQSLGTFGGAALASGGYAIAGWPGVAGGLGALMVCCGVVAGWGWIRRRPAPTA